LATGCERAKVWQGTDHLRNVEVGTGPRAALEAEPPRKQEGVGDVVQARHAATGGLDGEATLLADVAHDGHDLHFAVLVAPREVVELVHAVGTEQVHFVAVRLVEKELHRLQAGNGLALHEHGVGAVQNVPVLLLKVRQTVAELLGVVQATGIGRDARVRQGGEVHQVHRMNRVDDVSAQRCVDQSQV